MEVSAGPLVQSSRCATTTGAALGLPPLFSQLPLRFREKPMILGTSDTASLPGQHQHQPTAGSRAKWAQRARLLVHIREKVRFWMLRTRKGLPGAVDDPPPLSRVQKRRVTAAGWGPARALGQSPEPASSLPRSPRASGSPAHSSR